jgi:hypothetical protein
VSLGQGAKSQRAKLEDRNGFRQPDFPWLRCTILSGMFFAKCLPEGVAIYIDFTV